MLLTKIIAGTEKCQFTIIEDTQDHSSMGLLRAVVKSLAVRVNIVYVYLYETEQSRFIQGLPSSVTEKLSVTDLSHDLFGWLSDGDDRSLRSLPVPNICDKQQKIGVVIDCISHLVSHTSGAAVCQMLSKLRREIAAGDAMLEQLCCTVHRDLHDAYTCEALEHCANCVVNLSQYLDSSDVDRSTVMGFCSVVVKRRSGKLVTSSELYNISETLDVTSSELIKPDSSVMTSVCSKSKPPPDPTANLTFNLKIKPDEVAARSNVVLPFMSVMDKGVVDKQPVANEECDQDEEEDPDDDLDI